MIKRFSIIFLILYFGLNCSVNSQTRLSLSSGINSDLYAVKPFNNGVIVPSRNLFFSRELIYRLYGRLGIQFENLFNTKNILEVKFQYLPYHSGICIKDFICIETGVLVPFVSFPQIRTV